VLVKVVYSVEPSLRKDGETSLPWLL
jgi:hypothetical protein